METLINERLGQGGMLFAVEFAAAAIANVIFRSQSGERVTGTTDGRT